MEDTVGSQNPKGEVIVEATEENQVIISKIIIGKIVNKRRTIPYLRDLNRGLFGLALRREEHY
ncbi:hypothetical protein [Peribacillus glennii]|uniref:hypothetical protein n=1 Tax=Peribacillus glennii TaxID=2303991 RepID=UPI001F4628CF|nr:hypothetical protein [Peribacillus glennii]